MNSVKILQKVLPAAVLIFSLASHAEAQFKKNQLADTAIQNKNPVIDVDGTVVWQAPAEDGTPRSDVYIYQNGQRRNLTSSLLEKNSYSYRISAGGQSIVWQTTLVKLGESITWQLKEVAERDTPHPELSAEPKLTPPGGQNPNLVPGAQQWSDPADQDQETTMSGDGPRRPATGHNEICLWRDGQFTRITSDRRNDIAPSVYGDMIAWQKAKTYPFGWEIMCWKNGERFQLTTNYYYDMGAQVHSNRVVWYGWDGNDYEIYLYDHDLKQTEQVTDNQIDDISPRIWGDTIAWQGFLSAEGDIFARFPDGSLKRVSLNSGDDLNPVVWNDQIVWQGFDDDDFEIFLYDGTKEVKLTSNTHDDIEPVMHDGVVAWLGYHDNWDSEVFTWDGQSIIRLTEDDYEQTHVRTAAGRIVWQTYFDDQTEIWLAEPE